MERCSTLVEVRFQGFERQEITSLIELQEFKDIVRRTNTKNLLLRDFTLVVVVKGDQTPYIKTDYTIRGFVLYSYNPETKSFEKIERFVIEDKSQDIYTLLGVFFVGHEEIKLTMLSEVE